MFGGPVWGQAFRFFPTFGGSDHAVRRDDNERVRGVGPNTTAQTGGTLVGLSERRVLDPSDESVFVRLGPRHGVNGGEEYRP